MIFLFQKREGGRKEREERKRETAREIRKGSSSNI